ncbi:hypothetical protein DPMN_046354 [Dreissena polymorpha]|uniref:Uncharacterized protein n=1 Tax=Dreissena polymorpha TaxID=45954 RepID=A0A9D4D7Q3_DREPO|nr:hypothetical protein DPMN_046354 [Dreissena polymorpha]
MSQKLKAAMVFSIEWNRLVSLIHIRGIPWRAVHSVVSGVGWKFSQHPLKPQQE